MDRNSLKTNNNKKWNVLTIRWIQMNKISIDEEGFIMDLSNDPLFLTFNGKACIMD